MGSTSASPTAAFQNNCKIWVANPNQRDMAEFHNERTKPGLGFFFDFKATPEIEKPLIDYMTTVLGWKLDYKNTFLRKPK